MADPLAFGTIGSETGSAELVAGRRRPVGRAARRAAARPRRGASGQHAYSRCRWPCKICPGLLGGLADRPVLDGHDPVRMPGLGLDAARTAACASSAWMDQSTGAAAWPSGSGLDRLAIGRSRAEGTPAELLVRRDLGGASVAQQVDGPRPEHPPEPLAEPAAGVVAERPHPGHQLDPDPLTELIGRVGVEGETGRTSDAASGRNAHGTRPRRDDRASRAPGPAGSGWSVPSVGPAPVPGRLDRRPAGAHPQTPRLDLS